MKSLSRQLWQRANVCQLAGFLLIGSSGLSAQTFDIIHSLTSAQGSTPNGPLAEGLSGALYGTTQQEGPQSSGTIFAMRTDGSLSVVYAFLADAFEPYEPFGNVIEMPNGDFYGTTGRGGAADDGTVFQFSPDGTYSTLHTFTSTDGAVPIGSLVRGFNGALYGLTGGGGANGFGTIYSVTPNGVVTLLHSFDSSNTTMLFGSFYETLIQASDGNLYGTFPSGGTSGHGYVYMLKPSGEFTILHSFRGGDGSQPSSAPTEGSDGNFYGTTFYGGAYGNGTLYKITPQGVLTTLYSFNPAGIRHAVGGATPLAALLEATDGNFYGTTFFGGTSGHGMLYQITPAGVFTPLSNFGSLEGYESVTGLMQATDGKLYGALGYGGKAGNGSIYRLDMGLKPFIKTLPIAGGVGSTVVIQGRDLTGATSVQFAGIEAPFQVVSATEITTEVPAGATSGTVTVQAPGGLLASNLPFQIGNVVY